MEDSLHKIEAFFETLFGTGAASGGIFALLFHDVYPLLSFVAVLCGAILGIHGVYNIIKGRKPIVQQNTFIPDDHHHE